LRPFNVGAASDVSILELARIVVSTLGSNVPIEVARTPEPGLAPDCYLPDVRRASEELGLAPTVGLAQMIERTADWYRF
jgi:dTDP-glucose 4,6-dehydratase